MKEEDCSSTIKSLKSENAILKVTLIEVKSIMEIGVETKSRGGSE